MLNLLGYYYDNVLVVKFYVINNLFSDKVKSLVSGFLVFVFFLY